MVVAIVIRRAVGPTGIDWLPHEGCVVTADECRDVRDLGDFVDGVGTRL